MQSIKLKNNIGFVSAGNTGAVTVLSKVILGTLNNIKRYLNQNLPIIYLTGLFELFLYHINLVLIDIKGIKKIMPKL